MRKWFLGDDQAFANGLDEMGEEESEPSLSRPASSVGFTSTSTTTDPPSYFSSDETAKPSSVPTSPSDHNRPLAYQQRRRDRATHRQNTGSTVSSPLSETTEYDSSKKVL